MSETSDPDAPCGAAARHPLSHFHHPLRGRYAGMLRLTVVKLQLHGSCAPSGVQGEAQACAGRQNWRSSHLAAPQPAHALHHVHLCVQLAQLHVIREHLSLAHQEPITAEVGAMPQAPLEVSHALVIGDGELANRPLVVTDGDPP